MACHYPKPEAKAELDAMLAAEGFKIIMGRDAETSEEGGNYKRMIAFAQSSEELVEMAKSILTSTGTKTFVFREPPTIDGYEENRQHQLALVLNFHPLG